MEKTENSGLDFRGNGKAKERERDVGGEMVEVMRAAWMKAVEYHEAHIRKSSAMASGRERDVVGEMEEKDEVNQIEEYLEAALMLIKNCKPRPAMSSAMASRRTQIQALESDAKNLQLRMSSSLPDIFYTGNKAEGKFGSAIPVKLIDKRTGHVVTAGPVSGAKLDVVAVEGNFDNEDDDDWTLEEFKSHVVTDRDGKKLLTGDLELSLKEGVGSLGELTFTDNSSWVPNKKVRLGVIVASGNCEGIRVREAKSNPFVVKDRRGEGCKKHDLPAPDDEVWRLRNIGKNGAFRKRLNEAGIFKVRDFIWKLKLSCQELRKVLGTSMSNGKWETLVKHAETCDLSGKYYVYYDENNKSNGVIFENIFELCGFTEGGVCYSAENIPAPKKFPADSLIREACYACHRWAHIVEYHGPMLSDMKPSKRARVSATHLVTGTPAGSCHTDPQVQGPAVRDPPVPFDRKVPVRGRSPSYSQVYEDSTVPFDEQFLVLGQSPSVGQAYEDSTVPFAEQFLLPGQSPSVGQACEDSNVPFAEQFLLPGQSPSVGQACEDSNVPFAEQFLLPGQSPSVGQACEGYDGLIFHQPTYGIDQQDSTLFGTPVASRDQALLNQWLDVGDYDGLMPIDMNQSERERFPPTDTWAPENLGIDQQDSTLFGTPVASRDRA